MSSEDNINLNSKDLLNDILRRINSDIKSLRRDVTKLNDFIIQLNVEMQNQKGLEHHLDKLLIKIEAISNRIIDLEKAKEKIEHLFVSVDNKFIATELVHQGKSELTGMSFDAKIEVLNVKINTINNAIPWLKRILASIFVLIVFIIYATGIGNKIFELFVNIFT